jgi:hypothetical protein
MAAYELGKDVLIQSQELTIGRDAYAKALDHIGSGDWEDYQYPAELIEGTQTWKLLANGSAFPNGLDTSKQYVLYRNEFLVPVTAYDGTNTLTSVDHQVLGASAIIFSGLGMPSNLVPGRIYYLVTVTTDTFRVSETSGGAPIANLGALTASPISCFMTSPSKRSAPVFTGSVQTGGDTEIGTVGQDTVSLEAEGQADRAQSNHDVLVGFLQKMQRANAALADGEAVWWRMEPWASTPGSDKDNVLISYEKDS